MWTTWRMPRFFLYEKALLARDYGIRRDIFRDEYGEISPFCDITTPGFGGAMSDINSYIGCIQMEKLPDLLKKQKYNADRWNEELGFTKLNSRLEIEPNYWVYGILTDKKVEEMLKFRKLGFYASGVHLPNTFYTVFGPKIQLSGVRDFYSKFLAIPCGWWFTK